ncbi:MAG: M28 family peptidase [Bacteroidales bacterium]|nr:M28 family peptidase [Bacteroidales bacterium]
MDNKLSVGWRKLLEGFPWFEGEGNFPLPAYSEFMPPPRVGYSPYGEVDSSTFRSKDEYGWYIPELEEELELKPGLEHISKQIMHYVEKLGKGITEYHISGHSRQNLTDNPYWPPELAEHAGKLEHERFVAFLSLALSRTQDDKGRVRWTLFGGSEQGPENTFWKSFYTSPTAEIAEKESLSFIASILRDAYSEVVDDWAMLKNAGFRILPNDSSTPLPKWTGDFIVNNQSSYEGVRYLLTFLPFSNLPDTVKQLYLSGKLALLPFPGSLVFWGMPTYRKLRYELPMAMQIPLLKLVSRHSGHGGLRVPQSGWLHEHRPGNHNDIQHDLVNNTYHRTHRWQRVHVHEDELLSHPRVANLNKVLFSTELDSMGLYDKPMVRNCQIWTRDFKLLIDGPRANSHAIAKVETTLGQGGLFGYRFMFPAMRVGKHEVYWHRPVVAYHLQETGETKILSESLLGYMVAYDANSPDIANPIELWPRLLRRKTHLMAIHDINCKHDHYHHQTAFNIINLLDHYEKLDCKPLPYDFARHLIRFGKHASLEQWLADLPNHAKDPETGKFLKNAVEKVIEPALKARPLPYTLTYEQTAKREFEEAWWNDIYYLAHGKFINKDNADCIQDEVTLKHTAHHHRDLEQLGDYLISRHREAISNAGMEGKAFCGELPFGWNTDFAFDVFGGWKRNHEGHTYERNILVVIPGRNRKEAVVMGDHYDTAYMEDIYDTDRGGTGARISANGADDNYSATSTLLQAASIFLNMSKKNKLERDIWLIHLTGEEFPSDCMGARNFCQAIIEKNLKLHLDKDNSIDLSGTKIVGAFVMDMIGHNRDNAKDIFQISPGKSLQSLKIAQQAHIANMIWNVSTHDWNRNPQRLNTTRGKRSTDDKTIPEIARHLPLNGEVRTKFDPFSSIYNTDGQIFSDLGLPIVLFMENYDLHRTGYHDTKDTMDNIDLDYGAALAAICIETVARVAVNE